MLWEGILSLAWPLAWKTLFVRSKTSSSPLASRCPVRQVGWPLI